jgi:hypothetical protein
MLARQSDQSANARDVDHGTAIALEEVIRRRVGDLVGAVQVDVQHAVEALGVDVFWPTERIVRIEAGVVDDDIDAAELGGGSVDDGSDGVGIGHVRGDGDRVTARVFDCRRDGLDLVRRAGARDHRSPCVRLFDGDGAADAASAARYHCDPPVEIE